MTILLAIIIYLEWLFHCHHLIKPMHADTMCRNDHCSNFHIPQVAGYQAQYQPLFYNWRWTSAEDQGNLCCCCHCQCDHDSRRNWHDRGHDFAISYPEHEHVWNLRYDHHYSGTCIYMWLHVVISYILGGCGLGGVWNHIKALGPVPFPHQVMKAYWANIPSICGENTDL